MSYRIEPLHASLNKKDFSSGSSLLDSYLQKQAGQDIKRKLCAVFALTDGTVIIGYYTLSNASLRRDMIPESIQKKLPPSYRNLPVTLLGRLAVDSRFKGQGFGSFLLIDALKRSFDVSSSSIGSMAVITEPIDEQAENFYRKYGFTKLPDSGKMFLPMTTIGGLF